jgi:SAM-dependent methyltransferase
MENTEQKIEWFDKWFDSPYYHLLYSNRNESEAQLFMDHLCQQLQLTAPAKILDLPCGKGRHANYLASKGFEVVGADLSINSIELAKASAHPNATFFTHDIRKPIAKDSFDAVFNLFTSMGYFETSHEDQMVFHTLSSAVKPEGYVVVDYLNVPYVEATRIPVEQKKVGETTFDLRRYTEDGYIKKEIQFDIDGVRQRYVEQVKAFSKEALIDLAKRASLELIDTYGDYHLNKYQALSERLILIFKKIK